MHDGATFCVLVMRVKNKETQESYKRRISLISLNNYKQENYTKAGGKGCASYQVASAASS